MTRPTVSQHPRNAFLCFWGWLAAWQRYWLSETHELFDVKADANKSETVDEAVVERPIAGARRGIQARFRSDAPPLPDFKAQYDGRGIMQERRIRSHKDREAGEPPVFCAAGMPVRKREWHTRGGNACRSCADSCEIKNRRKE